MMRINAAEFYFIPVADKIIKILFQVYILYLRSDIKFVIPGFYFNLIIVVAEYKRSVAEYLAAYQMVPAECTGGVSPVGKRVHCTA